MRRRAALIASAWLSAAAALLAGSAYATDFLVGTDAQLRSAITSAANSDRIIFTNSITLAADLPAVQTNVTILGNNNTLDGANQFRGLFIGAWTPGTATQVQVTVGIQDLAIANAKAIGGNGSGGGGGGAGFGGAIFVANLANVTVSNVALTSNNATGGSVGGPVGGGGGRGGGGGAGGFGGGGGGGGAAAGGPGGFGGGGGTGPVGFGGGGAGMGGAIFVQSGGSLTLSGTLTVNGNTVTAGSGAFGSRNGSAFRSRIFPPGARR